MTFGSALTPDVIGYKALGRIQEFAFKLDIHLDQEFRKKISAALAEFIHHEDTVQRNRDGFLAAFWAGYGLYGVSTLSQVEEALS